MSLADFETLVDSLVRDSSGVLATGDRDTAIGLAVIRYSEDRPVSKKADITGTGASSIDLPPAWVDGFSRIVEIEYPIGNAPPTFLKAERFHLYEGLSSRQIMFFDGLPASEVARVTLTQPHTLDADTDTIPAKDRQAVANWAASLLLQQLANHYSGAGTPSIQADAVDWQSRGSQFETRAKAARQFYYDQIGVDPKKNTAAGAVTTFNKTNSLGGPRLVHRN